jgi:ABC-2 type transport system ATP-binding protein
MKRPLTFDVRPRVVTGFLGPNGSGKSTTLRLILGLDAPDSGSATIGGSPQSRLEVRPCWSVASASARRSVL